MRRCKHTIAQAGVAFSLASDDPALFQLDLMSEYLSLHRSYGWGSERLFQVVCAGVEHSFLPETTKRELRSKLELLRPTDS